MEGSAYEIQRVLGSGAFGQVCLAKHRHSGELVAIKRMDLSTLSPSVEAEVLNHRLLNHPHVVKLREVYLSASHLNVVMEYASGGSLFECVREERTLSESVARWFFQQLVLALDYCHRRGVGHRDIKLENVLLHHHPRCKRPLVKVCDFGYSKHDTRSLAHSQVGTLLYMAPEVIKPQGRHYDAKRADIWSCGVLLYTMLVGIYPFMLPTPLDGTAGQNAAQQAAALHQLMVSKQYSIPANLRLSAGCQQLLGRLLEPDPAQRLTMQGLLQDAWFREGLPPAASRMTSQWLAQPPVCCQSEGQLKEVIGMAITYSMDELSMQLEESLVE